MSMIDTNEFLSLIELKILIYLINFTIFENISIDIWEISLSKINIKKI